MPRCRRLLLLSLVTALAAAPALAGSWPRFRGPNGTGVAPDKDIPISWNEQAGILWKIALPGTGNSSPIVWGDRLFVQSASADGRERSLVCIAVGDGKVLWSRSVPGRKAPVNPRNTLASSTAATDGERVYASFWDGKEIRMKAFDFAGKEVWSRDLGPFTSQHGAGASPVVYRDKVLLANDQDGTSTLVALNSKTGAVAWQSERPAYRACYSAPFLREAAGASPELVLVSTMEVTGYNLETGAKNWTWHWKFSSQMPLRTTGSPVYSDGTLFAISGDGGGDRHMVAVHLGGPGKAAQPRLLWENKKDFPYVPSLLCLGPHVYFVNDKGVAGCYVAKTGERVWYERLPGATFVSSPVLIDGKVYAASDQGDVFVLAAGPAYHLLARNALGEGVVATPAVADGRLFIRGQQHLFCIGKGTGR
jgi:outer membrane protein assembly factor BamB